MDKKELYRQVFISFKDLCSIGEQPGSFDEYCRKHGVYQSQMRQVLGDEFQAIKTLPGYSCGNSSGNSSLYSQIYESFKQLCLEGRQPGSFSSYCRSFGVTRKQVHSYLTNHKLRVAGLPGYMGPTGTGNGKCQEVPFEDVIFEEAGFLPADGGNVITVKVDGHVVVSFPADTDVAMIARFIRKMRKEAGHVGS